MLAHRLFLIALLPAAVLCSQDLPSVSGGSISGKTVGPDGQGIAKVSLNLRSAQNPNGWQVKSDDQGNFTVEHLAGGYAFRETAKGRTVDQQDVLKILPFTQA